MRKDVKLAFAVGAILISVLIVYVPVVPGGDKRPDKQAVTLDQSDKPAPTVPQPAGTDKAASDNAASDKAPLDKPADAAKPAEVASDHKPADQSPTTKPTDPFAASTDKDKEDSWMLALNRGSVPMMTEAPAAPQPGQSRSKSARRSADESQKLSSPPTMMAQSGAADQTSPSTQPVTLIDPAPSNPGMRTHVVAKGETISMIAKAAYGSANFWPYIIRANPGVVAEKIRPGMTLNLPAEGDVKGAVTTSSQTTSAKPDATAINADTTSPKIDPQTQYEVQSGDSLAKIAMKLYGSSNKWQAIYDLNKEAIGDNPAKLKAKSVLKLPEAPTQK